MKRAAKPLEIAGAVVPPGSRRRLDLAVARLPSQTELSLPITVVHGHEPGLRLWLSATIHGDEANGIEIIRQVLARLDPTRLRGTVIAAPIVNIFGFLNQSRYLPDRRDLNRSFPGSPRGSLAARLAHLFMTEIVSHCTHGIDLHTGSHHRKNIAQVRANLRHPVTRRLAKAFSAPVTVHAATRDGSLREAAAQRGIPVLLFEGGEAQRFDAAPIQAGVRGVLRVMDHLGMGGIGRRPPRPAQPSIELESSRWVRARRGGILRLKTRLGEMVEPKQELGVIADSFGECPVRVRAPFAGLVIGLNLHPLVHQGDAVAHVGLVRKVRRAQRARE